MPNFLIDVNLPYHLSIWKSDAYIHQINIDEKWTDDQIWLYSKENKLTIITKDMDFSNKMMLSNPPPKVIHIRFGNMKMKDFHENICKVWISVLEMNASHKLVNVFTDRIEGIQ